MKKQILRWLILGGTLFFLAKTLKDNWLEVTTVRIDAAGWAILVIAVGVSLLAHTWAGWVWTWIFRELNQPLESTYFIQVYLKTNIAKYIPGNIWHYYGRIVAVKNAGVSSGAAILSVLLEPLLMAVAALIVILFSSLFILGNNNLLLKIAQIIGLVGVLFSVHPRFFNPVIQFLHRSRAKSSSANNSQTPPLTLRRYPVIPLLGELGFLILRSIGFILAVFAVSPLNSSQIPLLISAFSFAWLIGFVLPVAPGGLGVFEATAIALLEHHFPSAVVISAAALYRLISILAETGGATLAWLDERF